VMPEASTATTQIFLDESPKRPRRTSMCSWYSTGRLARRPRRSWCLMHDDGAAASLLAKAQCGRARSRRAHAIQTLLDGFAQGDDAGLARAVLELATDPAACWQMAQQARRAFEVEFDTQIVLSRWEVLLNELSFGRPQRTQWAASRVAEYCLCTRSAPPPVHGEAPVPTVGLGMINGALFFLTPCYLL
jgi:hypothetical protein